MKKSKYLNKTFGDWTCTYVGLARVQSVRTRKRDEETKKLIKSKRPGHMSYYYIFERPTSDKKANKMIRLDRAEAAKLYRGELDIEMVAEKRLVKATKDFTGKVSYQFISPVTSKQESVQIETPRPKNFFKRIVGKLFRR